MKYKTLFRLGLKLLGVFLVFEGIPRLAESVIDLVQNWVEGEPFYSSWVFSTVVGLVVRLGFGLYLFFGGRWIADLAIPSNRAYCHECAYELKGLPAAGVCPECGTAYSQPHGSVPNREP